MTRATVTLTTTERAMLEGERGEGAALAMRLVLALARSSGATRLLPITTAHVDGCLYHGAASLDFVRRLRDLGASVSVPTTSNVGSVDLIHPDVVRSPAPELAAGRELMETYVELGCRTTFTCAPYQQLAHRPGLGEHVAWAESNAIAFVNSVLGARTARYGDFIDISAAITGRVPDAGFHRDADRLAGLVVDVSAVSADLLREEAGWGALGLVVGGLVGSGVPALIGIEGAVTEDHLKAFGAGAASSGTVGMFHVVGVTPEAPDLAAVVSGRSVPTVELSTAQLRAARDELSPDGDRPLEAVSLGTPHFSLAEFGRLAALLDGGPPTSPDVEVFVSTSRALLEEVRAAGLLEVCERAGVRIVVDTCTYVTPILGPHVRHAMTNSAKWAWYAPANVGVTVTLGTLEECVASARAGRIVRDEPRWA